MFEYFFPDRCVLVKMAEVSPNYQIIVDRADNFDTLEVKVEVSPEFFLGEVKRLEMLGWKIKNNIQEVLRISRKKRTFIDCT